ncbi:MAG TPA: hypothetical protein DCP61_02580 [Treponema sp.]|nr:hypothetical protein [Treponema sp.]
MQIPNFPIQLSTTAFSYEFYLMLPAVIPVRLVVVNFVGQNLRRVNHRLWRWYLMRMSYGITFEPKQKTTDKMGNNS